MTTTTENTADKWTNEGMGAVGTLYLNDFARIRVMLDDIASRPDYDMACPVLSFSRHGFRGIVGREELGNDSMIRDGLPFDIVAAIEGLTSTMSLDTALDVLDRWLRAFYGGSLVTATSIHRSDDNVYVAYDTRAMREYWGQEGDMLETSAPDFGEYMAWVNGDTYRAVREERVSPCECDNCEASVWEEVDAIHGRYGEDSAREGALEYLGY